MSPFDMIMLFSVSLCLMQDLVHNILIPIQALYIVGACTACAIRLTNSGMLVRPGGGGGGGGAGYPVVVKSGLFGKLFQCSRAA